MQTNQDNGKAVADEILRQLGGRRFVVMTGAKNLMHDNGILSFRLPKAKDGINYVKVALNAMDLYDVEFRRVTRRESEIRNVLKAEDKGVYFDQLPAVFEERTGLATHL